MWESVMGEAVNYGIWAVLFVALIVYLLRDTSKREKKYQEMIAQLHDSLRVVEQIQNLIKEISASLTGMNKELGDIKRDIGVKDNEQN